MFISSTRAISSTQSPATEPQSDVLHTWRTWRREINITTAHHQVQSVEQNTVCGSDVFHRCSQCFWIIRVSMPYSYNILSMNHQWGFLAF